MKMVTYFHNVKEKFGYHREKRWSTTISLNLNRVMDDDEFEKCILNSIVPLYPDKEDIKEQRVMVKKDSRSKRININMLAKLRNRCMRLYPRVPNKTSVPQETHRNYGELKSRFRKS